MECNYCGYEDNDDFVGIFANGISFTTTNGVMCGLFGCPRCRSVQYVTDVEYINKRKEMYKNKMKSQ